MSELWAGAECTVNRVGDRFNDQLRLTGHHDRDGDFAAIAGLGVSALRLPILWERVIPDHGAMPDWAWSDACIGQLQDHAIRPIAGLVHHGSGPAFTSLLDPDFGPLLAEYGLLVARRYPTIRDWTPVNEPLTTARFSALYGHWYPHHRDERQFWIALLNQIDGVRLAMQAIRSVNPEARLIQTDDLGRTFATAPLADQAGFDNVRRWMSWDLLAGKVTPEHDFWQRLCGLGLEARLLAICESPCRPDVIGINHYLTSDRFLDHRLERYPGCSHGGNAAIAFADVAAIRVLDPPPPGLRGALTEAWQRYRIPLAVTEAHNGCTREEQLRWLASAWKIAENLCQTGVDVIAVTAWALFGSQGWNTLLIDPGEYEPGVFDIRGGSPRPTAIARWMGAKHAEQARFPAIRAGGWWQRDIRLHHPTAHRPAHLQWHCTGSASDEQAVRPILITGASGTLGQALAAACAHRNLACTLTARDRLDLCDTESLAKVLQTIDPCAVINAAGWVRVDEAEAQPEACMAANAIGAVALARACAERGMACVNFSSDLVFGHGPGNWSETDATAPLNVYGQSKSRMEEALLGLDGEHLIIRTAAFFSPHDRHNFAVHAMARLKDGMPLRAAGDQIMSPTFVPDLCNAALDLLIDGATGIWHLSNGEGLNWASFAKRLALACGLDPDLVQPSPGIAIGWTAPRPANSSLGTSRGALLPSLDTAIARFAEMWTGRHDHSIGEAPVTAMVAPET